MGNRQPDNPRSTGRSWERPVLVLGKEGMAREGMGWAETGPPLAAAGPTSSGLGVVHRAVAAVVAVAAAAEVLLGTVEPAPLPRLPTMSRCARV